MYYCEFPNCDYSTNIRSQIHKHHIISRAQIKCNKKFNTIFLCPNCHTKIYIPEVKKGIHSKHTEDSIILIRWLMSTSGKVLEYKDINNNIHYYQRS